MAIVGETACEQVICFRLAVCNREMQPQTYFYEPLEFVSFDTFKFIPYSHYCNAILKHFKGERMRRNEVIKKLVSTFPASRGGTFRKNPAKHVMDCKVAMKFLLSYLTTLRDKF